MKVLLAISNPRRSQRIKRVLEGQQYVVSETDRPHEVLATAFRDGFDLLLLDAASDPNGGAALCMQVREAGVQTPLLVLSASGSAAEAAQTIDAGADDVVSPSVETPELLARVRALRRRDMAVPSGRLHAGDLWLDVSRHAAVRGTDVIKLSATEFALLEFFLRHPYAGPSLAGRLLVKRVLALLLAGGAGSSLNEPFAPLRVILVGPCDALTL